MSLRTVSEDEPHELVAHEVRNQERTPFRQPKSEQGDMLSDENVQAAIDALSDEGRDKLVRLAAERLSREGVMNLSTATEQWTGACFDIMRSLIENDMSLDDLEG